MSARIIESTAMPAQQVLPVPGGSVSQAVILKQQQEAALQTARNKIGGFKRQTKRRTIRRKSKSRKHCQSRTCHYRGRTHHCRGRTHHYRGRTRHYRGRTHHYRGGAAPLLQVPPTPVGADSATKANYELLTKVAQQQQTNSIFDKAKTPADTAVLNAKQQSLYSQ